MNTAVAAPRRSHHAPLSQVKTLGDAFDHPEFKQRIAQAAPKHMSADRMLSTFILAVRKTPKLAKCDLMSFLGACVGLAAVGLEPNTPLGHAYLIPFDEKKWNPATRQREFIRTNVQVIFGYTGLLDLTYRSGLVRSVHADVAWQSDKFDFHYGSGAKLYHKPMGGPRGEDELPVWAYMHAVIKGEGSEAFEVSPIADILKIRNQSQAYQAAVYARDEAVKKNWKLPATWTEAPWVKFPVPMIRKTVFRGGSKWLPKSVELAAALQWDEAQERKAMDYGAIIDGEVDVLGGGIESLTDESDHSVDLQLDPYEQDQREEAELASTRRSSRPTIVEKGPAETITDDGEVKPVIVEAPAAGARGAPGWPGYMKALQNIMKNVHAKELEAFATANREVFLQAPPAQRLQIVKLFQDHCAAVNLAVPDVVANLLAPDGDKEWVDAVLADFLDIPDVRQIGLHMASFAIADRLELMKKTNPALRQVVFDAAAARVEELERIAGQEEGQP